MITLSQDVRIERIELPDNIVALLFTDPARIAENPPLVFVQHGLGSRKERHLDLCLRLAKAGYRACTVDARLHGERQTAETQALEGDRTAIPFLTVFGPVVTQTVADISLLADELGVDKCAIVGHSMGGFIALVAALTDRRITAVVNVAGSLQIALPESLRGEFPPQAQHLFEQLDALNRADEFWPIALLIQHGDRDQTVPVEWAHALYSAVAPFYAESPDRLRLTVQTDRGHEFTPNEAEAAVEWLQRFMPTA